MSIKCSLIKLYLNDLYNKIKYNTPPVDASRQSIIFPFSYKTCSKDF